MDAILLTTDPAVAAEAASNISLLAGRFGVDWKTLTAQIINFCIVAFLLYQFAFKPVLKTLGDRQKKIADGLQYAEEMEQKLKDAERQHASTLREATKEAKGIVDAAREQSKSFSEQQMQEAVARAEQVMKKAEEALRLEKQKMVAEAKQEIATMVIKTTEKVLEKNLSQEDRSRFTESALGEIKASEVGVS